MDRFWQKSYGGDVPAEITIDPTDSVTAMFERATARFADTEAFDSFGATMSYREFDTLSRDFAAYLQSDLGLAKGDRVAVMMPNLMAFPVAFFGIIRAGGVQVNVNPLYTPRELKHQLNDAGVETIVIFSGSTPVLAEIIAETAVKTVIVVNVGDFANPELPSPPVDPRIDAPMPMQDAVAAGKGRSLVPVDLNADDLLFLQYTGGTTGLSKGAMLSHGNLLANVAQFKAFANASITPGDEVAVTALPLYHIFALMVNLIAYVDLGAKNYLVANPRDIDGLVGVLQRARPTMFTAVNTLFAGLLANPGLKDVDMSRLRVCAGGGSAIHAAVSNRWFEVTGEHIREGYGLSETSPILTINPFNVNRFSGTVGLPMPSTDIKLLDADNREVGIGEEGEICAAGPQVMRGYWKREETRHQDFTEDGYFRTGDIGVFGEDGYLRIVDRKKDMVLVSGFNVFPNEIEATIAEIDGVAESACIGVPDGRTGEALRVFVVPHPGAEISAEDIVAHCRTQLTAYKVPHQIRFVDELPKSTVGKILRRELRDLA